MLFEQGINCRSNRSAHRPLRKLLEDGSRKFDPLQVTLYRHVLVGGVQVVVRRAKATKHSWMGHVDHDRALGADTHYQRWLAPHPLGSMDHCLADRFTNRSFVGIGASRVDVNLNVVKAVPAQVNP